MGNTDMSDDDIQEIMLSGDQLPEGFENEVMPSQIMLNPVFDGAVIVDKQKEDKDHDE